MLILKNIVKTYGYKETLVEALKSVSLTFEDTGFISILGPSGCGKTTLLNIIGGLDKYSSGELIIDNVNTSSYTSSDFDDYRNKKIGFVFQNYQLINHLSVLSNVELPLTLSGLKAKIRKQKALKALKTVGVENLSNKKPIKLSGGQAQRVSIARALINDPSIVLADEPTGALDTASSKVVMDLLSEISKTRLVIMVTHNEELASSYSNKIIRMLDGNVINIEDGLEKEVIEEKEELPKIKKIKKSKMSFFTALFLSLTNIRTKLVRTIITSISGSIGIIGISLVLSISNGFNNYLETMQKENLSNTPITVLREPQIYDVPNKLIDIVLPPTNSLSYPKEPYIYPQISQSTLRRHINTIDETYVNYVDNLDQNLYHSIYNSYYLQTNILGSRYNSQSYNISSTIFYEMRGSTEFMKSQYEVLSGEFPKENEFEGVVIVDKYNQISVNTLITLGFYELRVENGSYVYNNISGLENITFDDITGLTFKWIPNNVLYKEQPNGTFARLNNTLVYESEGAVTMKISGVLRQKKSVQTSINGSGFYYTKELTEHIFNNGFTSDIVLKQMSNPTIDVFNGSTISAATYTRRLQELGGSKLPYEIRIYPTTYQARDKITEYLNHYNDNFSKEEKEQMVLLENYDEIVGASVKVLVKGITAVLVVLAGISLVVSSVMIGIITYVSVMERTQEIGILRSVGARKLDIVSVFSSETFFIGLTSGILGIAVSLILSPITSMILEKMTTINSLSIITLPSCILLIVSSILLTLVAGSIPSAIASLKNPVECLKKVD